LDQGSNVGETGVSIQNAYNRLVDYGDDQYLRRHRFTVSYMWELPIGPGKAWLSNRRGVPAQILGGWAIEGVTLLQTGQRFTPSFSGSDPSDTNSLSGRPDRVGNGNLPSGQRSITRWFDPSAFVVPPANAGRFGNADVGILEGPGTINFDIGLYKGFRLRERGRLQFSATATNSFNHPNFGLPAANISVPSTVGTISSVQVEDADGARTLILGARISFSRQYR